MMRSISRAAKAAVLVITTFCLSLAGPAGAEGNTVISLGVSPPTLNFEVLRGQPYEALIRITYAGDEETELNLTASGDISDWVTFCSREDPNTPIESIMVTGGESTRFWAKFNVPENAPVGISNGILLFTTSKAEDVEGIGAKLQAKTEVSIDITGTPVLSGIANSITTRDVEVNYPLRVKVDFKNTGNVVATPKVDVSITKNDTLVDAFTYAETKVKPERTAILSAEWDTIGREHGDYKAQVVVSLGEEILAENELAFSLLPVGTLSREGMFTKFSLSGQPELGTMAELQATFFNTGQIDTKAIFVGEVYHDGKLINTLQSEELLIPVAKSDVLKAYLNLDTPGHYSIKGYINYEGKRTDIMELSFDTDGPVELGGPALSSKDEAGIPWWWAMVGAGALIALALGGFLYRARRKQT